MKLWRGLYWLAILAILIEALGLVATFGELRRRRGEDAAALAPDQIAAVVRLWPQLTAAQKPEALRALSWSGLNYRVVAAPRRPNPARRTSASSKAPWRGAWAARRSSR